MRYIRCIIIIIIIIHGSVSMFNNGVIHHKLNGAGVAGDCTTQCNFEQRIYF